MPNQNFDLTGEFITLDSLLKAVGIAPSGGAAKAMIASGAVKVDGDTELRKTCKIRAGQTVTMPGTDLRIAVRGNASSIGL